MISQYLKKAPTLIVIGVTGYAGWPILFPESPVMPPKSEAKAPAAAKVAVSTEPPSARNPFEMDRPPAPVVQAAKKAAAAKNSKAARDLPDLSAEEERMLQGLKLGGTFIDSHEKLALIDNKVYARGDQLRKADGTKLPYVIADVFKDRAVIRRGRRNFVLSFSNVPRTGPGKADGSKSPDDKAMAKREAPAKSPTLARSDPPPRKGNDSGLSGRGSNDPDDQKRSILQLLLGASSGGSGGSSPLGGAATAAGLNPSSLGAGIDEKSLSTGLDALMGKFDNIGQGGALPPGLGGETP